MTELQKLINELCPNGVEYTTVGECCNISAGGDVPKDRFSKEKTDFYSIPIISNGIGENALYGYTDSPKITENAVTVAARGTIGYAEYRDYPYYPIIRLLSLIPKKPEKLSAKFLFYSLQGREYQVPKSGIPQLTAPNIKKEVIPLPPLPVQREIVRILDSFTELTAELTAKLTTELTARKTQYEYYRNELLGEESNRTTAIKTIGEVSTYRRGSFPQPYGNAEWYDGEGAMPFVQIADIGEDMRLVSDTKRKISKIAQPKSVFAPKGSIIISLQGSIGRIAVTQYDAYIDRTVAIFNNISNELLPRYFVYQLQRVFAEKEKTARGSTIKTITKEEFTAFPIAIPSIAEQERIVAILDRFDTLCNDISFRLPAEIEARQKQYEYYRDKLLTFKEKVN